MPGIAYITSSAVAGSDAGGTTTTNVTMATTIPIGSDIVVFGSNDSGGLNVTSVSDSQGNSYSLVIRLAGTLRVECWEAHSTTHALTTSDSVTLNHGNNAGVDWRIGVSAYSNVNAVGTNNTKSQTSTTPTISLTTQDANNFVVVGFMNFAGSPGTITANTGSLRVTAVVSPSGMAVADNTAASATSVTVTVNSTASQPFDMIAVELRSQPTTSAVQGMPVFFMG